MSWLSKIHVKKRAKDVLSTVNGQWSTVNGQKSKVNGQQSKDTVMKEQDNTLLNDYFNGLLPDADAQKVRDRAAVEPEFAEEFSLRIAMAEYPSRAAKRTALTDTLSAVEKDFFQKDVAENAPAVPTIRAKVNWTRWAAAVAAGLVLVFGAVWFFNQSGLPEYRQYAQHAPLSLTVRGVADQAISNAEKAFAEKDYAGALAALEQVIAADPSNITAQLYRGICLLEMNRTGEARAALAPIALGQSALRSEANWYIALSYLKEKNINACKSSLEYIEPGADHYEEAQEMMKKLQ